MKRVIFSLVALICGSNAFAFDFYVTRMGAYVNSTNDSSVGFQSAINAAQRSGGGNVIIPAGSYVLTNYIGMSNATGIKLIADPGATITYKTLGTASYNMLNVARCSDIVIQGGKWIGATNFADVLPYSGIVIRIMSSTNVVVENLSVSHGWWYGIDIDNQTSKAGTYYVSNAIPTTVNGVTIANNEYYYYASQNKNITIRNVTIDYCGGNGLAIEGVRGANIESCYISNTTNFYNKYWGICSGIDIEESYSNFSYDPVSGHYYYDTGITLRTWGMDFDPIVSDVVIDRCRIESIRSANPTNSTGIGVRYTGGKNVLTRNTTIRDCDRGVNLGYDFTNAGIIDCLIFECNYGIAPAGYLTRITGCTVTNCGTGIYAQLGNNGQIGFNNVSYCATNGIVLAASPNTGDVGRGTAWNVFGNTITSNSWSGQYNGAGIKVHAPHCIINDNIVSYNYIMGIYVDRASPYIDIINNTVFQNSQYADATYPNIGVDHSSHGVNITGNSVSRSIGYYTSTATAGGANTIDIGTSGAYNSGFYVGMFIDLISGMGAPQTRQISAYTGYSSYRATVSTNWSVNPDSSTVFQIRGQIEPTYGISVDI